MLCVLHVYVSKDHHHKQGSLSLAFSRACALSYTLSPQTLTCTHNRQGPNHKKPQIVTLVLILSRSLISLSLPPSLPPSITPDKRPQTC